MKTPPDASSGATAQPWYREPIAWLVFGIPVAAILSGIAMLWVSISTYDGIVVDDYYKKGLAIDRVLARDDRAAALNLSADLMPGAPGGDNVRLSLQLHGNNTFRPPAQITLKLLHATRAGLDRELMLARSGDSHYSLEMEPLEPGPWHAQLEAQQWRLTTRLTAPFESALAFRPISGGR